MAIKKIYTLDGTVPSATSPVATGGLIPVKNSSRIISANYDDVTGKLSTPTISYARIVPSGYDTKKYYSCHLMVDLGGFAVDANEWMLRIKNQGYNLIWLHLENYSATDDTFSYNVNLKKLMDACEYAGIHFIVGISYAGSVDQKVKIFQDSWDHPAILTMDGRRVYTDYSVFPSLLAAQHAAVKALGMGDYIYWANTTFPYNYNNNAAYFIGGQPVPGGPSMEYSVGDIGEDGKDYKSWAVGAPDSDHSIEHVYDTRPFDGIIFFCGDNYNLPDTISVNQAINRVSKTYGKLSSAANLHFYSSTGNYQDLGFDGTAKIWNDVLALPPTNRTNHVCDITANDMVECTYLAELCNPPVDGLAFAPGFSSNQTLGSINEGSLRFPITDHSGMQKFYQPWVKAFLNNQPLPLFTQDKIFCRHMLHPWQVAASPAAAVPYLYTSNTSYDIRTYLTNTWGTSLYVNPHNFTPVLGAMNANAAIIYMAVHLTAPAQLKINDTLSSATYPSGYAVFSIPGGTYIGPVRFAIVRNGVEVKYGYSPQDIFNDPFPGGWGLLSVEINENNYTTPEAVTLAVNHIDQATQTGTNDITASHVLGGSEIEMSIGFTPWVSYTGTINIGNNNVDAGLYRFRTKAATGRNVSPIVRSPQFIGS